MHLSALYSALPRAPKIAFVVGTGPSMAHFPVHILKDAFIVGLNRAWRYLKPAVMLTAHPELYSEFVAEVPVPHPVPWVVRKTSETELDCPDHYGYLANFNTKTLTKRPPDTLYMGEGVQCTAIDLLARMGAQTVILVGCDMTTLGGAAQGHPGPAAHVPAAQYALYRQTTARVRSIVRDAFGVEVLTLSPFIGAAAAEEDYARLKGELGEASGTRKP